jgi:hypothetical protein
MQGQIVRCPICGRELPGIGGVPTAHGPGRDKQEACIGGSVEVAKLLVRNPGLRMVPRPPIELKEGDGDGGA